LLEDQHAWTVSSGKEANETELHPNMKGENGFLVCKSQKPTIHAMRAHSLDKEK
jgi:hypothetical protein